MDPATKARRLSWGMGAKPPRECPILARGLVSGNPPAVGASASSQRSSGVTPSYVDVVIPCSVHWHLVCCLCMREDSMKSVAGIFTSRDAAERAVQRLASLGISRDHLTLLTPGADGRRLAAMPIDEGEAPGTGAAIGAVTGMATGAGVGLPIGAAVSLALPGIGPIIAFGLLGAPLFGARGAAIGNALENTLTQGGPRGDIFVLEDAPRGGQSVVLALGEGGCTPMTPPEPL